MELRNGLRELTAFADGDFAHLYKLRGSSYRVFLGEGSRVGSGGFRGVEREVGTVWGGDLRRNRQVNAHAFVKTAL